ncbi:hypothetical protein A8B75_00100 [Sphingomonadales bacterium EhC05]|nr:hypothetical protein A8B75_00100 [Sphingomonadales bacterium EhC05]
MNHRADRTVETGILTLISAASWNGYFSFDEAGNLFLEFFWPGDDDDIVISISGFLFDLGKTRDRIGGGHDHEDRIE